MNISGKKINELDSIAPTLQTVLPAVYVNGTEVSETAGRISLQDIKSLIGGGGGGGGGGIQSISWYDNNVGTELTIMDIPDTTVVNVYKNGVLLREGADNDYTVAGNVITFSISLEATDTICVIMGDPGMQLNLGDLSGAVVELSNIITAGKKQIANSLVNKGVTDIKYTDSLSKMADAIDSLVVDSSCAVNPNFPILFWDSSYNKRGDLYNLYILGNYFVHYTADRIGVTPIPTSITHNTSTTKVSYTANDLISAKEVEPGQQVTSMNSSYCHIAPIIGSNVALGRKYLYIGGTCRALVDLDESLALSSVLARDMTLSDGTTIPVSTYSMPLILGINYDKDIAILNYPKINSILKLTISTGVYETLNMSALYNLGLGALRQIDINTTLGVRTTRGSERIVVINWNWDNIENTEIIDTDCNNASGNIKYGFSRDTNKNISQIWFARQYTNTSVQIWRYFVDTRTFYTTIIPVNSLNKLNPDEVFLGATTYLEESLVIKPIDQTTVLFWWGGGYVCLDISSIIPTPVYYINNSSLTSALSVYGWTSAAYYTNSSYLIAYENAGNLYIITQSSPTLYFNLIDIVYNKVLATVQHKNNQEAIYKNSIIVTRDNIQDGGPFDANTISLPVDI